MKSSRKIEFHNFFSLFSYIQSPSIGDLGCGLKYAGLNKLHSLYLLNFPLLSTAVLMTANFKADSIENMDLLLQLQPNRPILVSEFWPGWFDHWFEPIHNILSVDGNM